MVDNNGWTFVLCALVISMLIWEFLDYKQALKESMAVSNLEDQVEVLGQQVDQALARQDDGDAQDIWQTNA